MVLYVCSRPVTAVPTETHKQQRVARVVHSASGPPSSVVLWTVWKTGDAPSLSIPYETPKYHSLIPAKEWPLKIPSFTSRVFKGLHFLLKEVLAEVVTEGEKWIKALLWLSLRSVVHLLAVSLENAFVVYLSCGEEPARTNCVFNLTSSRTPWNYHCIWKDRCLLSLQDNLSSFWRPSCSVLFYFSQEMHA